MSDDKTLTVSEESIELTKEESATPIQQNIESSSAETATENNLATTSDATNTDDADNRQHTSLTELSQMAGSHSVLQDLLRDHTSEIGNWCEIVSNHQDEPTSTTESFRSQRSSIDIEQNGPFYILAMNLYIDTRLGYENSTIEAAYRSFGGHKHLFAIHLYQNPQYTDTHTCMLMAKSFESCVQILRMDGNKLNNGQSVKLEYVIPGSDPPRTHHFTPTQLDAQMLNYRDTHPVEVRAKADPFGAAKPIDITGIMQSMDQKVREERKADTELLRQADREQRFLAEKAEREKQEHEKRQAVEEEERQRQQMMRPQVEMTTLASESERTLSERDQQQSDKGRREQQQHRYSRGQQYGQQSGGHSYRTNYGQQHQQQKDKRTDSTRDGDHRNGKYPKEPNYSRQNSDNNRYNQRHERESVSSAGGGKLKATDSVDSVVTNSGTANSSTSGKRYDRQLNRKQLNEIHQHVKSSGSIKSDSNTSTAGPPTKSQSALVEAEPNSVGHQKYERHGDGDGQQYSTTKKYHREFKNTYTYRRNDHQQQQRSEAVGRGKGKQQQQDGGERRQGPSREQQHQQRSGGSSRKSSSANVKEVREDERVTVAESGEAKKEVIVVGNSEDAERCEETEEYARQRQEDKDTERGEKRENKKERCQPEASGPGDKHSSAAAAATSAASSSSAAPTTSSSSNNAAAATAAVATSGQQDAARNEAGTPASAAGGGTKKGKPKKSGNKKNKNNSEGVAGGNRFQPLANQNMN